MKRFNLITGTVMALAITTGTVQAQQFVDKKQTDVHVMSKTYTWPQDQAVLQKLDKGFEIRGIVPLGTIFGKRYQRIMAAML